MELKFLMEILKEFELADTKITTDTLTLQKGSANNGGSNIYDVGTAVMEQK